MTRDARHAAIRLFTALVAINSALSGSEAREVPLSGCGIDGSAQHPSRRLYAYGAAAGLRFAGSRRGSPETLWWSNDRGAT